MNYLLKKYLPQIDFDSYEEFRDKFTINVPEDFNFGYDVVDAWADAEPDKRTRSARSPSRTSNACPPAWPTSCRTWASKRATWS